MTAEGCVLRVEVGNKSHFLYVNAKSRGVRNCFLVIYCIIIYMFFRHLLKNSFSGVCKMSYSFFCIADLNLLRSVMDVA